MPSIPLAIPALQQYMVSPSWIILDQKPPGVLDVYGLPSGY